MANITITIPDAQLQRVKDALGDNPKIRIIELIKEYVLSVERQKASMTAMTTITEVDII